MIGTLYLIGAFVMFIVASIYVRHRWEMEDDETMVLCDAIAAAVIWPIVIFLIISYWVLIRVQRLVDYAYLSCMKRHRKKPPR